MNGSTLVKVGIGVLIGYYVAKHGVPIVGKR